MVGKMKHLTQLGSIEARDTYWLRRDPTSPERKLEENLFTTTVQIKYSRPSNPGQLDTLRFV